jgi:hypothetical protein
MLWCLGYASWEETGRQAHRLEYLEKGFWQLCTDREVVGWFKVSMLFQGLEVMSLTLEVLVIVLVAVITSTLSVRFTSAEVAAIAVDNTF